MKKKKIYFAADAHLGNRYADNPLMAEKKLVRWLDRIKEDAQAVYFLGDMFDYWYEYKYVVPKGHIRFLGKLAELSDLGIEIHLFIGNHDIWMFDYLPKEIGAVIHQGPLTIDLLGKRFFLAHGDEVGAQARSFRFLQAMFRNKFCQWLYAGIHPRWTFEFAMRWSHNSRMKGLPRQSPNPKEAAGYLINFTRQYLRTHPDIDFFVFGHCHTPLDMELKTGKIGEEVEIGEADYQKPRLLVAGDWMRYFSYIQWDGSVLSLLHCPSFPNEGPMVERF